MTRVDRAWEPRGGEDRLLQRYWEELGRQDTVYTEVGVAGKRKPSPWQAGSTQRRIDAVRLLPPASPGIFKRWGTRKLFAEPSHGSQVELIEIKQGLSEEVIGQCLVGRSLFREQYPKVGVQRTVALCKVADPAMRWVCEQNDVGVEVVLVPDPNKPGDGRTSRSVHQLDDTWLARIEPWRRQNRGLFLTKIPVGGGSFADGSKETYVNLVRIPQGPDLLAMFDTRERLLAAVGAQSVELIEVRPRLSRGVVGRVIAHAKLLAAQYGIDVTRRIIIVRHADTAVRWACEQLGIEVEVVGADWNEPRSVDEGETAT